MQWGWSNEKKNEQLKKKDPPRRITMDEQHVSISVYTLLERIQPTSRVREQSTFKEEIWRRTNDKDSYKKLTHNYICARFSRGMPKSSAMNFWTYTQKRNVHKIAKMVAEIIFMVLKTIASGTNYNFQWEFQWTTCLALYFTLLCPQEILRLNTNVLF
jgi:hypothetical protein